jgi:GT2 family glycosyltransferase
MRISVVIPTKNRPIDLKKAILSVTSQSLLPDELIVVDQSSTEESREITKDICQGSPLHPGLIYHLDPKVRGLVDARRVGFQLSSGDLVLYLEDDIELSKDYLKAMVMGFQMNPAMMACTGIMTNYQATRFYQELFLLFHRGIYRDTRIRHHGPVSSENGEKIELVPIEFISGGISAYRRAVLAAVPFDTENEFFAYEDVEYSARIKKHFGRNVLFLNRAAHLQHHYSITNRDSAGPRIERKSREVVVFFKKHRDVAFSWRDLVILELGLFVESLLYSVKMHSFKPAKGYIVGTLKGISWKIR